MKNLFIISGCFIFSIFLDGFARIVILFYHGENVEFFGPEEIPGLTWMILIYGCSFVGNWLSAMLGITLSGMESSFKIASGLILLILLWRFMEYTSILESSYLLYSVLITSISIFGILTAYILQRKLNNGL